MKNKTTIWLTIMILMFLTGVLTTGLALAQQAEIYPTVVQVEGKTGSQIDKLRSLPKGDWRVILSNTIKLILQITGSLAFISFTVAGVIMITSQGNEEKTSKGKGILLWSVLALVIIAVSYAIVLGITQLPLI